MRRSLSASFGTTLDAFVTEEASAVSAQCGSRRVFHDRKIKRACAPLLQPRHAPPICLSCNRTTSESTPSRKTTEKRAVPECQLHCRLMAQISASGERKIRSLLTQP
eukprot:2860621-Rhodomonas_salina.1